MKKGEILKSGDVVLPAPTTLSAADEIIWTSDTGRTLMGRMVGDVVAEKKNLSIKWEWLTDKEVKMIKNRLIAGFFRSHSMIQGLFYRSKLTGER